MTEPFLGEIRQFAFDFAPVGWAQCNGQIMSIAQNTALFALIGTYYGGNGQTTFALPDLRGRVGVHVGQGPGLSAYSPGQQGGQESVTLVTNQLPAHGHPLPASTGDETTDRAVGAVPATGGVYAAGSGDTTMTPTQNAGGSQPHSNVQPYLATNYCIALQGVFPSQS